MKNTEPKYSAIVILLPFLILLTYIFTPALNTTGIEDMWIFLVDFRSLFLFLVLVAAIACLYARIFQRDFGRIFAALAILLPLMFFLAELKVRFNQNDPFSAERFGFYGLYTQAYFAIAFLLFGFLAGKISRFVLRQEPRIFMFYLPVFVMLAYFCLIFISLKEYRGFSFLAAGFLLGQFSGYRPRIPARWGRCLENYTLLALVIFTAAFIVRYFWGMRLISLTGGNFLMASDDGVTYSRFAGILARGEILPDTEQPLVWGGLGYWHFLGIIYRIFGANNYKAVVFIQSLLNALVPVSIFYIARTLFNKQAALISSVLCIFSINLIFLSGVIGMEALFVPLMLAAMALLIKLFQGKNYEKTVYLALFGIFFGIVSAVRMEVLLFPLVILVCMFISLRREIPPAGIMRAFLWIMLGVSAVLLWIGAYNYVNYGKFTVMTQQAAVTFGLEGGSEESIILNKMGFNPFRDFSPALKLYLRNPWEITRLMFKSCLKQERHYLFVSNFGTFDPFALVNCRYFYLRYPVYLALTAIFFLLLGIILALKEKAGKNRFALSIILGYFIYTMLIYALIRAMNIRHRGVLEPFFLMFISYGFYCYCRYLNPGMDKKISPPYDL